MVLPVREVLGVWGAWVWVSVLGVRRGAEKGEREGGAEWKHNGDFELKRRGMLKEK